jgi:IS5 family transposase
LTNDCGFLLKKKAPKKIKKMQIRGMDRTTNILFSHKELLHEKFFQTDLGILYQAIPFEELAKKIPLPKQSQSGLGRKPWFDVKGGIALQFLKHYLRQSDAMLMERINTDWSMQLFCGIVLKPGDRILDSNLPSSWRTYLGKHLDLESLQKVFASHWKPLMKDTNVGFQDATCYESNIAYPTDAKLLWQCCEDVHAMMQAARKRIKLRKSRSNFEAKRIQFLDYQKRRKKSKRLERKIRKTLLKYLLRLLNGYDSLREKHSIILSKRKTDRLKTIVQVYDQQHGKAYGKSDQKIQDRIVSLNKPYIRPIVRGKEIKPVEFGAKVNKLQVDGISFIEHLSFDAFNESTRYKEGIYLQRKLFGRCTHHSADAIYATNKNRKYASSQTIQTNFIPKGKQKQEHIEQSKIMRNLLNKQRSTVLEGSFGNEKNHYLLQKVKARNKNTEICWIFFGMMTANCSIIAKRMLIAKSLRQAA